MNQPLGLNPYPKKTKSYGDMRTPMRMKNTIVFHTCVQHFWGLNPFPHALPLDLPWVLLVPPLQQSTEAVPLPWLSPSLSISELRIMSNKNQWTWMRRMRLLLQMNIKRGMPSR